MVKVDNKMRTLKEENSYTLETVQEGGEGSRFLLWGEVSLKCDEYHTVLLFNSEIKHNDTEIKSNF